MNSANEIAPGGFREVMRVAWPLIISTGSFTLMQFCDRMFLAWHSAISIQAALPAGILSFTLICGFMALAGYANTFVAQYFGAGDPVGCSRSTAQAVWMSLLCWPLLILLIPFGRWLLELSGHPAAVLEEELLYFTILMIGGVHVPLQAAISSFFTGRGDTRTNMVATVIGNVVNIGLDYAMIFGHWGFPAMGIRGAAWATVISGFVTPAILFALYFSKRMNDRYLTRRTFQFDAPLFWRMIRFGLPSGLHLMLDVASFAVFVLLTGRLGELALSVSNMAFSINMVAFMPLVGISIAASTVVGQYQGRRDSTIAERAGWTSLRIGVMYMSAIAATYILFPSAYYGLFINRADHGLSLDEILPLGRRLLIMMATWGILDAANLILSGALKGAGDTRFVMWYSTVMAWGLLVPGQWVIVMALDGGILLSWAWLTFFIMIVSAGFFWRFRSGRWKGIELLDRAPPAPPGRAPGEALVVVE